MFQRIKGTQDFLDLTLFNFIVNETRNLFSRAHFTEIATPILEPTELFKRSLGMETDVVNKEMYIVKTHDGDDSVCLRPEGTAPIVRAFVNGSIQKLPWKVFTVGPMFRYERPQKGRYRQFHQVSIEVIGAESVAQDAYLIKLLDTLFSESFKMGNYALHINFLGTQQDQAAFKLKLDTYLDTVISNICATCKERKKKNILRVFDCKNPACQDVYRDAPNIVDNLSPESAAEWQRLKELLEELSVSFSYAPNLVRGLDYYSKTVFEFVSTDLGSQNAFCAGGRYNELVKEVGGKQDQPAIGAAFGIERLMLLLEAIKPAISLPQEPALHLIVPLTEEQQTVGLLITEQLQRAGLHADVVLETGSVKSMMRKANNMGAQYAIIIGKDEQEKLEATVKNMVTGDEQRVKQTALIELLKK